MSRTAGAGILFCLAIGLAGCGRTKQADPRDAGKAQAEAKRQKAACASSAGYGRLKDILFDRAIGERGGNRAALDTLADYSVVRMENPVVEGWDPSLDITRCAGRFVLMVPPGAERGLGGERRLEADVGYTAQASADGNGFVYRLQGAEEIVARIAGFNLVSGAYRPPAAIDEGQADPDATEPDMLPQADAPSLRPPERSPSPAYGQDRALTDRQTAGEPAPGIVASRPGEGEATVRAFYGALAVGNGRAAAARIMPGKRSSPAFSPEAMSRFYGGLVEPIRLMEVVPLDRGAYRVRYRYSAGRSRCDGSAVVTLVRQGGRTFIRSIDASDGC
ncbi:hypothetical protein [Sphingomonas solaris]|uniref:Lipoprotein n=1 Tax=Alterirhizorhabdus solaris TaxID=2529389 RepID=A0A558R8X6_9SPHN|nr:hypothetical protein [Sphingomonas solaris]TVV75742.1 hypothetical protein FOY91_06175 [Sphingomonas solaris]